VEIRECGTTSPTYNVTVNFSTSTTGVAFKGTGTGGGCGTTFDGSRCWEVITLGVSVGNCNITTTQIGTCGNLTDCAPPPTPPTPPTPTPPTPPATVYARYGDCATGGNDIITEVSGPGGTIFPNVLLISGICYEYLDLGGVTGPLYSNYTSYTDCATCQSAAPTPTPPSPPTPTPSSCFAINNITRNNISANDACAATRFNTHYFDNAQFCDATLYYGTDSTCTSLYGFATYVTNGSYTRYWTGTSFQSCIGCP
jgi:hypothetical protein